jgi:hypothetical protein
MAKKQPQSKARSFYRKEDVLAIIQEAQSVRLDGDMYMGPCIVLQSYSGVVIVHLESNQQLQEHLGFIASSPQ